MIQRYAMAHYDRTIAEPAVAWLEANGIEPRNVPQRAEFVIADDQITYEERVLMDGHLLPTVRKTVPLQVPMPAELDARADWRLAPRLCDRCQADLNRTDEAGQTTG